MKKLMMLVVGVAVAIVTVSAFGESSVAPSLLSPNGTAMLTAIHTDAQKTFLSKSMADRRAYAMTAAGREAMRTEATGRWPNAEQPDNQYAKKTSGTFPQWVTLTWTGDGPFTVEVFRKADDKLFFSCENLCANSVDVFNCELDTEYVWRVSNAAGVSETATFKTDNVFPRLLWDHDDLGQIYGVRDLGGAKGRHGLVVKQGLIIRSSEPMKGATSYATDTAFWTGTALDGLGIRYELDLRSAEQTGYATASGFGDGVIYDNSEINSYQDIFEADETAAFKAALDVALNPENYPLNFHGQIGMDRTGSLALVLEALLGMSKDDIMRDYESSWFWYKPNDRPMDEAYNQIDRLLTCVENFDGSTFNAKVASYCFSIGVTQAQLDAFRTAMLGEGGAAPTEDDASIARGDVDFVTLPTGMTGYGYVVSNLTAGSEIRPDNEGGYALPIGAKVGIYAVAEAGYVIVGTNPYVIDEVTADTAIDASALPTAQPSCVVTVGDHAHLAVAWTRDDGTVTNAVDGASFEVAPGTENVKVIFTADDGWEIVGDAVVELGTVTEDIGFGEGNEYRVPTVCMLQVDPEHPIVPLELSKIFQSNMVIQRDRLVRVWGKGPMGETVTVSFAGQTATSAVIGEDDLWEVAFARPFAANPTGQRLKVSCSDGTTITLDDVLVGDVWIAAGESNMVMPVNGSAYGDTYDADATVADMANHPQIRWMAMDIKYGQAPTPEPYAVKGGAWGKAAKDLSAVAYHFAHDCVTAHPDIPVGIIGCYCNALSISYWTPGGTKTLWNCQLAPITRFAVRGAIWYQGETDACPTEIRDHRWYGRDLLKPMVAAWRKEFGVAAEDFPFYFVQLAGCLNNSTADDPSGDNDDGYRAVRESMFWARRNIENCGMVVAWDCGRLKLEGETDLVCQHPRCKNVLGKRLARLALRNVYGDNIVAESPYWTETETDGIGNIRVKFDMNGSAGLTTALKNWDDAAWPVRTTGEALKGFSVAGSDKVWHWADAVIESAGTIRLSSSDVAKPLYVRNCYRCNPVGGIANGYNEEMLPIAPIATEYSWYADVRKDSESDDPPVVTLGDHPHLTVAWTGGDGSVTNAVDGTSFEVSNGTENVKVIFTAEPGWEIVGNAVVELGTVTEDVVFGAEGDYMVPEVAIADSCLVAFGRGSSNMTVVWTSGDGSVTNAVANKVKAMYVPRGSENVRIICTANPGYELIGESVFDLGTVTDNFTFGKGNDFVFPTAYDSAKNVVYLDWDEANGRMTNAVARAGYWRSVEDSEMAYAMKGCMVVTNDVTIPIAQVAGAAVLVLCNDATLTVTGTGDEAGIHVPANASLTITVRKGSTGRVVAQGGADCAGIGSQFKQGSGSVLGAVRIVAGTVTATGGKNGAGIGNGFYGKDGSVKIFGGAVTATGGIGGASDIGDGSNPYSPCEVSVSGGVFAREPQGAWCADHFAVFANDDPASRADYPYAVLPACTLTIGKCPIHVSAAWTSADGSVTNAIEGAACTVPFGKDVRVIFTAEPGWELVGESVVNLGTVTGDITFGVGNDYRVPHAVPAGAVSYLDWDAESETLTNATVAAGEWTLVTEATRTLNGGWYVVAYDVVLPAESNIVVNGSAHLILCDGARLSVTGGYDQAAIEVLRSGSVTNTLTIYGQTECTGRLTVQGGDRAASIGAGFYGDFGAVTINGGTVTATGGWGCPAIGNGWWGQRGTVTINAGRVVAAGDVGRGNCAVFIRSGIFGMSVPDAWCAEHHGAFPNPDSATSAEFPYVVLPAWTVTIGDRQHMTVEWTSDDGQMTNVVEGTSFKVRLGERNVRVIFTVDPEYILAGDAVVPVGTVNSDIVFGVGNDFKAPHAGVPYLDWDEVNRVMTNAVSPVACDEYSTSIRDLQDGHWYVVRGEHTIDGWSGLRVSGDVHLVLCDESSLKVFINRDSEAFLVNEPGIEVGEGSSLTVYGQTNGSGRLTVNGGDGGAAGIGGRSGGPCGVVTINGGVVTATGGSADEIGASGIGTGDGGYGGRVTINGGVVTATGNEYGAGIGDDYRGRNMTVIINGGTVTATGGADGASIKGDNVTIIDGAIDVGNMGGVIAIFGGVFRTQPQVGWLAAARSVVPNMDLTTADTHPWRVVESAKVVSLDAPLGPFATAEEATNAMATAVFVPSEEIVSRILLRGVSPRRYSEKFGFGVTSKGEGAWYVEAALTDAAKAYLAETATKATRQIPVAEIAKYDEETIHGFWVQDCEPGFYYTLYCAAEVCSLPDKGTKCGPAMCFEDGKLMFNWVDKPSEAAGFFTIGVSATKPSSTAATP